MENKINLRVLDRQLVANGMTFGKTDPYERLAGKVHYAVDSSVSALSGIVDLDKAPRNADGLVEFDGDFLLLKPLESSLVINIRRFGVHNGSTALPLWGMDIRIRCFMKWGLGVC